MTIQCQAQVNINKWFEYNEPVLKRYLVIIKKDVSFFNYWCKPRSVVHCIVTEPPKEILEEDVINNVGTKRDDDLIERYRAVSWIQEVKNIKMGHVPGKGHGKQLVICNTPTFCAREMEIGFIPERYKYSSS